MQAPQNKPDCRSGYPMTHSLRLGIELVLRCAFGQWFRCLSRFRLLSLQPMVAIIFFLLRSLE